MGGVGRLLPLPSPARFVGLAHPAPQRLPLPSHSPLHSCCGRSHPEPSALQGLPSTLPLCS